LKRVITAVKILIIVLIFYLIFKNIYSNWGQLDFRKQHFNLFYIVLSVLIMQLAWMTTAWSWGKTLEAFNFKLRYSDVFTIYFRSMVAKYLPGKLWQIVGSTYMAAKKGVPEGSTVASVVIGQGYSLLSGLALVAGALALGVIQPPGGGFAFFRWTAIPILVLLIILTVRPELAEPLMNWALRLAKRQTISLRINIATSLRLFMAFLIPWFIFGLSFWFLGRGLEDIPISHYLSFTAIMTASTVIGFLAVFAPGGLGVKEGLIVVFLTTLAGYSAAFSSAIAIGFRIITSFVELLAFGITWVITWSQKKSQT